MLLTYLSLFRLHSTLVQSLVCTHVTGIAGGFRRMGRSRAE